MMIFKKKLAIRPVWVYDGDEWEMYIVHENHQYHAWLRRKGVGMMMFMFGVCDKYTNMQEFCEMIGENMADFKAMYDGDFGFVTEEDVKEKGDAK